MCKAVKEGVHNEVPTLKIEPWVDGQSDFYTHVKDGLYYENTHGGRASSIHSDVRSITQTVVDRSSWNLGEMFMGIISRPSSMTSQSL
jgi:hypothetical protein